MNTKNVQNRQSRGPRGSTFCLCDVCITELCKTTGNNCFVVFRVYTENVHVHAERSTCRRWVNTDEKCRLSDVELLQQFSIVVYTVPNTTKVFSDYYSCLTHGRGFGPSMSWVGLDEYLSSLYFNVIIILYCMSMGAAMDESCLVRDGLYSQKAQYTVLFTHFNVTRLFRFGTR